MRCFSLAASNVPRKSKCLRGIGAGEMLKPGER